VSLPPHQGLTRLLHIHRNVPGVMAQVNERFSRAGINIAAQYLRTHEEVGYVVIDLESDSEHIAMEELCGIEGTIRCRVLY
jgi:D-3-phosphoglycerate dehydrogenase